MKRIFLFLFLMFAACRVWSFDRDGNRPYVQSGPGGAFYARCIPAHVEGTKGTTRIYQVGKGQDELMDSYEWYAQGGIVLSWSPLAGKVAVMARSNAWNADIDKQVELSFYLGGKRLRSYKRQDLKAWGAGGWELDSRRTPFKILGEEQIPGTNQYLFSIEIKGKKISFDTLTGEPYTKP